VPNQYDTYYEPFLGAGAVYFGLSPQKAVLGDVNGEVINAFRMVQCHVEALIESLHKHRHTKKYFYALRELDRQSDYWVRTDLEKASRLMYLNKTCFNGLYRVNARGEFNVPFGDYENPRLVDEKNLRLCSALLENAELRTGSYLDLEAQIQSNDFVYLDPPYAPLSPTANFSGYTKDGFTPQDQVTLAEFCQRLNKRGVKFLLSNSHTEFVLELYSSFHLESVEAPRAINSKSDRRGKVLEVLVRNYE
jgi:DNA adenine methylase